ncbi:hypothetical protein BT96DRAFT_1093853 [Gymnopus androsaceus JB14]|uniref:F-box domain-containing protein n=1 Tax=Gymnopus androsaceus JB14 TaxID=1447944 RepID=A0A6A4HTB6_9AGAR|nr:hypothetical protein BT96DRAFT_1093853 [Gymnopus androsaceus JB14]
MSCTNQICTLSSSNADSFLSASKNYEEAFARIRSNDIPKSAIERSQLRALVEATRNDLGICNADDISRGYLAKTLECYESLLAPIRTLPSEIMISIFKLVVWDDDFVEIATGPFRCSGPIFPLTWVNYRWREIIISQPSFWSSLDLFLRVYGREADFQLMADVVGECLLRSGTIAPLHLKILVRGWDARASSGQLHVLNMLNEHAYRWKEIVFECLLPEPHLAHMLNQICSQNTSLPALEVVNLSTTNKEKPFLLGFFGPTFIHLPRLHTLFISLLRSTDLVLIDLQQLTTFRINHYIGCSFAALLENCPLLEHLEISEITSSDAGVSSTIPFVHHTHLTSLHLNNLQWFPIGLWQSVHLPNLTHLEVNGYMGRGSFLNTFEEVKTMLVQSKCVLQHIHFHWHKNGLNDSEYAHSCFLQGILISPTSTIDYKYHDKRGSLPPQCFGNCGIYYCYTDTPNTLPTVTSSGAVYHHRRYMTLSLLPPEIGP